ncbi:hypothetical protein DU506_06385 [Vreelandella rituensis]|uniref:Uncharacterized protein n=1 Tax=Vreelandella rituensis TaxID=2282306 RepID=A0A368U968_9GAMM|nr:hypothetical protein DU506_06385 [Halomonas rituensis]
MIRPPGMCDSTLTLKAANHNNMNRSDMNHDCVKSALYRAKILKDKEGAISAVLRYSRTIDAAVSKMVLTHPSFGPVQDD